MNFYEYYGIHKIKCIWIWIVFWWKDVSDIIQHKNMDKRQGFKCWCGFHYPLRDKS